MPNSPEDKASSIRLLPNLTLAVLAVAAVAIVAIFFRPGGFSIEGGAQGPPSSWPSAIAGSI